MSYRYLMLVSLLALLGFQSVSSAAGARRGQRPLRRFEYAQLHMGVRTRLVVYASSEARAEEACEAAFHRIAKLEDVMSDYRPTSDLSRLSARSGGSPVYVIDDLFHVLQRAQRLSKQSDGAFDVTVGPYITLWRQARQDRKLPAPEALAAARAATGWRKVRLDPRRKTVQLAVPGMRLDLGGIAKGYAGDCAVAVLRAHGIDRALFEAGGDIVVSGPPPGQKGWRIEVASLSASAKPRFVALRNAAISTSGDTEQYVVVDGTRYSHVVDPRTGLGLTDRLAVTVIAPDGLTSDSLATALCVLGPEKARELLQAYPSVKAYFRRATTP